MKLGFIVRSLMALIVLDEYKDGLRLYFMRQSAPVLAAVGLGRLCGVAFYWDGRAWLNESSNRYVQTPVVNALLNALVNAKRGGAA